MAPRRSTGRPRQSSSAAPVMPRNTGRPSASHAVGHAGVTAGGVTGGTGEGGPAGGAGEAGGVEGSSAAGGAEGAGTTRAWNSQRAPGVADTQLTVSGVPEKAKVPSRASAASAP